MFSLVNGRIGGCVNFSLDIIGVCVEKDWGIRRAEGVGKYVVEMIDNSN